MPSFVQFVGAEIVEETSCRHTGKDSYHLVLSTICTLAFDHADACLDNRTSKLLCIYMHLK